MKYIALKGCRKPNRTDALHYSMFHGTAGRDDVKYPNSPAHSLDDDFDHPLLIDMGGTVIPDIFMPCTSPVVSTAVRSILESVPNIQFAPVRFRKLVNYPYRAGDFSYYRQPDFLQDPYANRSDELLQRLPDDPTLHRSVETHYELILPNMYRMSRGEASAKALSIPIPYLSTNEIDIIYSPLLLPHYPLFWDTAIFFERSIFDTIEPFIDWDYFTSTSVDL